MLFVIIALVFPAIEYKFMIVFVFIANLIVFLMWIWGLLNGIAFVQKREFYVFKNLK